MNGDVLRVRLIARAKEALGGELGMPEAEAHVWLLKASMNHRMLLTEVCLLVVGFASTGGLRDLKELLDLPISHARRSRLTRILARPERAR